MDGERLRREAKRTVDSGLSNLRRWWSEKYKRPSNDPLFESRPVAEWMQELYEDIYERKKEIEADLADNDVSLSEKTALSGKLARICRMLGEPEPFVDPLADKWDRELDEGKIPDLDEVL